MLLYILIVHSKGVPLWPSQLLGLLKVLELPVFGSTAEERQNHKVGGSYTCFPVLTAPRNPEITSVLSRPAHPSPIVLAAARREPHPSPVLVSMVLACLIKICRQSIEGGWFSGGLAGS